MPEEEKQQEQSKKKLPIKTIGVVFGCFVIEAVVISAIFMMSGGPADVGADDTIKDDAKAEENKRVEVLVIEEKFNNYKEGRLALYDAKIYIAIKSKHEKEVTDRLERMKATISQDINIIIGQMDPTYLMEPTRATLKRRITEKLNERIGMFDGEPLIDEVLITRFLKITNI